MNNKIRKELKLKNGFATNFLRGTAHCFSFEAFEHFLQKNGYSHMIRGHQYQHFGISVNFYLIKLIP